MTPATAPLDWIRNQARSPKDLAALLSPAVDYFSSNQVDTSRAVRGLVDVLFPDFACEDLFNDTEDAIAEAYATLQSLDPGDPEYTSTFSTLRTLQTREAERLTKVFEANRHFDAAAARATIARADELLALYENPAAKD